MKHISGNPKLILDNIKNQLKKGVVDRHHGFHTPVFSNIINHNTITSRTVVLRKFDYKKSIIFFHSDLRSKKNKNIIKNSNTFFVFYDLKIKYQLRIETISKVHHNNDVTALAWKKTLLSSRKCYLAAKPPGTISDYPTDSLPNHLIGKDPTVEESQKGYENFSVIENKIKNIDWLYLSSKGHRKLLISINKDKIKYDWAIP